MNDIIHLNSIKSDGCDCNKPKKQTQCGCLQLPKLSCYQPINLDGQYFKVSNLFSELKSEWQRAEARSNLGVTDIIDVKLVKRGEDNNGVNDWRMIISKGGIEKEYHFYVKDGEPGKTPKISIGEVVTTEPGNPIVGVTRIDDNVILSFGIPLGRPGENGEKGQPGKSAYELAKEAGFQGELADWLASLKGDPGESGAPGADGNLFKIKTVSLVSVANKEYTIGDNETFSGRIAIWRITLENEDYKEFWVPLSVQQNPGGNSNYRYNVFLFKKVVYSHVPTNSELLATLTSLQNEVLGRTESLLTSSLFNWVNGSIQAEENGMLFIFMASCTVTNSTYGNWTVVRLTPTSASGENPAPNTQGLLAPVIRMRGEYDSDATYVNETYKEYTTNTETHFIDIVFYQNNWYSVNAGDPNNLTVKHNGVTVSNVLPTNTAYWTKATTFDFTFIETLIAEHISSLSIDTREIRIHGTDLDTNKDLIVAGMTSGSAVTYDNLTERLQFTGGGENSPVRIWAGTNFDPNGTNPNFNLYDAKFRVHLSGHMHAENADIEGTVEADILRLGPGSFRDCSGTVTMMGHNYTLSDPLSIELPALMADKVQMYYILTDHIDSPVTLNVYLYDSQDDVVWDSISFLNANTGTLSEGNRSAILNPKKLYLLFGVNKVWRVCEINLAPIVVSDNPGGIVDPKYYDFTLKLTLEDTVGEPSADPNYSTIIPAGTLELSITNKFTSDITVYIPSMVFNVYYDPDGGTLSDDAVANTEVEDSAAYTLEIYRTVVPVSKGTTVLDNINYSFPVLSAGGTSGNYLSMNVLVDSTPAFRILQDYSTWYPAIRSDIPENTEDIISGSGRVFNINKPIISATY